MIRKKCLAILCITILSVGLIGCNSSNATSKTEDPKWEVTKTIDIAQKNNVGGFYNDTFGMTVGYDGEIHYCCNWLFYLFITSKRN